MPPKYIPQLLSFVTLRTDSHIGRVDRNDLEVSKLILHHFEEVFDSVGPRSLPNLVVDHLDCVLRRMVEDEPAIS